ncbi:MAG: hypothetical protein HY670_02015 [Chloroflexi bacterium]|nr:hypothetical protein [Chloroflexota bacterium]
MAERNDYSGAYQPDLKLEDFSKETLVKLLRLYARFYLVIDAFWYLGVRDHVSNEQAVAIDIEAWQKMVAYEMKQMRRAMDIHGHDVATLMKLIQLDPLFGGMDLDTSLSNPNHGILTIKKCGTLEALEREGGVRIKDICGTVDPLIFQLYARLVGPKIETRILKRPPRQSPDEICCQWEFFTP